MKMKALIGTGVAVATLLVIGTVAGAVVNYDPENGGFVGKGDVQTALGWNNKQLQQNAGSIVFQYSDSIIVEEGPCLNQNTGAEHPNDVWERTSGVQATVQFDARQRNQITGFLLGSVSGSGGTPVYTDQCGGQRLEGPGTIIDTQPGDGLEVSGDGGATWVALPNTPPAA